MTKYKLNKREIEKLTSMPRITASSARKRVMWLVRLNGAVSHRPGGTFNCAPPFFPNLEIAATALSKASVLRVTPSPTPPKSVKLKAVGRSLGMGLAGAPPPKTRKPPTTFLCHKKTEAKAAIQRSVKRVLCEVNNVGNQRRRSSLWWWKRPIVEVSTMVESTELPFGEMGLDLESGGDVRDYLEVMDSFRRVCLGEKDLLMME